MVGVFKPLLQTRAPPTVPPKSSWEVFTSTTLCNEWENPAIPSTVSERQSPTFCYQYKFRVLSFSGALSAALTSYYVFLVSFLLHVPDFSFSYFLHSPPTSNTPPPSSFLLKDNLNSYFTEKTEAIQEVLV